jgi:hypothetical protein
MHVSYLETPNKHHW